MQIQTFILAAAGAVLKSENCRDRPDRGRRRQQALTLKVVTLGHA